MKWRKSSYSDNGQVTCVELAGVPGTRSVAARDSKNPAGPCIELSPHTFRRLLGDVKAGRFDL